MNLADAFRATASKPRNKYGAKRTTLGGKTFASKKEARRFAELSFLERAGDIAGLLCQPRFKLVVNGVFVGSYVGDFEYVRGGARVIEDVKGGDATKTPIYRLKKKLMKAVHGLDVTEV